MLWQPRRIEIVDPKFIDQWGYLTGQALWSRGFSNESPPIELKEYLHPKFSTLQSPFSLLNMNESAERLARAIQKNESVLIWGDYDVDGTCGLSLMARFLISCGHENFSTFQSDRFKDGYGVHAKYIESFSKSHSLLISIDTGIGAVAAGDECKKYSLDFIICDHHEAPDTIPDTPYIINPKQKGDLSELNYLCGTGVAFYLTLAVRQLLRKSGYFKTRQEPDLRLLLDFFALATISDVVPLIGDNRTLVKAGLQILSNSRHPGVQCLVETNVSGLSLGAEDVAFKLTPKINAASRMGRVDLAKDLLASTGIEQAQSIIQQIMSLNDQRRALQKDCFEGALKHLEANEKIINSPLIIAWGPWHEGVLGIAAAKLMEKFSKPAIALGLSEDASFYRGSMRSVPGVNCVEVLNSVSSLLLSHGGHELAAGLSVKASNIENLCEALLSDSGQKLLHANGAARFYDGSFERAPSVDEIRDLNQLEPFGCENPAPLFSIKTPILENVRFLKNEHLKAQIFSGTAEIIGFGLAEKFQTLKSVNQLIVRPDINRFRGRESAQLRVIDIQ